MEREIADLVAGVSAQRERVLGVQRAVERMEIGGSAADGDVTVRLAGTGRVIEVVIDPRALHRYDARELGEIVTEAVNDGTRRLGEAYRRQLSGDEPARSTPW